MDQWNLEPDAGRVLQWLVGEYQRQIRGTREVNKVEAQLKLKRGRLQQLLSEGGLDAFVGYREAKGTARIWLTSEGYADALNLLAGLPHRH